MVLDWDLIKIMYFLKPKLESTCKYGLRQCYWQCPLTIVSFSPILQNSPILLVAPSFLYFLLPSYTLTLLVLLCLVSSIQISKLHITFIKNYKLSIYKKALGKIFKTIGHATHVDITKNTIRILYINIFTTLVYFK